MRVVSAKIEPVDVSPVPQRKHWPRLRWAAAIASGLISGAILIVLPQGVPWSALNAFSGAVMGRIIEAGGVHIGAIALHIVLAVAYALIVAAVVRGIRSWRALPAGAAVGLMLYFINLLFVSLVAPQWTGQELRVAVAHLLFGLFAAAVYAGFTQRKSIA